MTSGQYDVYHRGNRAERITVTVDGHRVTITGPRWTGRGVVTNDGDYHGIAICPQGTEVFHHAVDDYDGTLHARACYPNGERDMLEWRPVEED